MPYVVVPRMVDLPEKKPATVNGNHESLPDRQIATIYRNSHIEQRD